MATCVTLFYPSISEAGKQTADLFCCPALSISPHLSFSALCHSQCPINPRPGLMG